MRPGKSLIGALAVAGLLVFASPASAQRHGGGGWHGHPGGGWHGHPGWSWHGHPGWGWHGYPGYRYYGPRVAFAVGAPFWGWGYPYAPYGYYPYAYAPGYAYRAPQVYEGRVVTRQPVDAKDVSSRGE